MTSWVLTIASEYPRHWDIAKEHMLWDMTKTPSQLPIKQGDVVYFWLSKHGFVGRAEVAGDNSELSRNAPVPWIDEGERQYRSRIRFSRTADLQRTQVSWGEVMAQTGLPHNPSLSHRTDDPLIERWLAELFEPWDDAEAHFRSDEAVQAEEVIANQDRDTRERTLAEIDIRRGQPKFRRELIRAYNARCAVTGSSTLQVLEAAHIFPYRGAYTNVVQNGLLLRSDVHTLFDLRLLTIAPEKGGYTVRLSPEVNEPLYRSLDHERLAVVPDGRTNRPSERLLREHNNECDWLGTRPSVELHHTS